MSDAPKKRPLFQIHLSTAIVLMFVAGGLVWVNCYQHSTYYVPYGGGDGGYVYGWPFTYMDVFGYEDSVSRAMVAEGWTIDWRGLLANVGFVLLILVLVAVSSEWLLGRNQRRHE